MRVLVLGVLLALSLNLSGSGQTYADNHTVASATYTSSYPNSPIIQAGVSYRDPHSPAHSDRLQIDSNIRRIGGAGGKNNIASGQPPLQKFVFQAEVPSQVGYSNLIIGRIKGINTSEAHQLGLSKVNFISSPTVIKVNGQPVGYIYTEAQNVTVQVPNRVMHPNGFNTVQIEAGFYYPTQDYIAYDEVEFQDLALEY
jgi:hypothetical protein